MKVNKVIVGSLDTNCYILEQGGSVLLIDPGDDFAKIERCIDGKKVIGILVTHRHFDHIGALEKCIQTYQAPLYEASNVEEKEYQVGTFTFSIIFTPGHSKDSVTYYFTEEEMMFVGDFIFAGTIGRCDLEGGDYHTMMESIAAIKKYPRTKIYPGHGSETTLDQEKIYNPYFNAM